MKLRTRLAIGFAGVSLATASAFFAISLVALRRASREAQATRSAGADAALDSNQKNLDQYLENHLPAFVNDHYVEADLAKALGDDPEAINRLYAAITSALLRDRVLDVVDVVKPDGALLVSEPWRESASSGFRVDRAAPLRAGKTGYFLVQTKADSGGAVGPDGLPVSKLAYGETVPTGIEGVYVVAARIVQTPDALMALTGQPDEVALTTPRGGLKATPKGVLAEGQDVAGEPILSRDLPLLPSFDEPQAADRIAHLVEIRSDPGASARRAIFVGFLTLSGILVAGSFLAASVLSRRFAAPIDALADGARALAHGDLDYRVPAPRDGAGDELADLVDAFNRMARDLKDSRARLVQSERIAAWREIARRIAHEIKNPLTPIQLAVETTRRAHRDKRADFDEIFAESAQAILEEVESLKKLVKEFSEFARMPEPVLAPEDLNDTVRGALRVFSGLPDGVTLEPELSDGLPKIVLDREQISRAVINLVANAADAVGGKGTIRVRTNPVRDEAGPAVEIHVIDDGPGIPAAEREKIFTPYYTTKTNGTGLGLAIVQRIVTDHGGEIAVGAGKSGAGADFTIRLRAGA